MARDFTGGNEYLEISQAVLTAVPLTIACWFNSDNNTAETAMVSIADSAVGGDWFNLYIGGGVAGDPISAWHRNFSGVGGGKASTSTGITLNTWHHAAGVFSANDLRACFIDGGSKGTNTTGANAHTMNTTSIGRNGDSSPAQYFDGHVAEIAIWNVALTDAEVAILANGYSPLFVRPQNLAFYLPLIRNADNDLIGGLHLTEGGTPEVSIHPRIIYLAPQFISFPIAAAPPPEGQPAIRRLGGVNHSVGYNLQGFRRW